MKTKVFEENQKKKSPKNWSFGEIEDLILDL